MPPDPATPASDSLTMTVLSLISRLRHDLFSWWGKRAYHPEKRYMRGPHDA